MHVEHLDGVDSGLIVVVSLSWLEVEDGSIRRLVGSVGVTFGGRSRGNMWGGGNASGGCVWFVGGFPFIIVSNGRGEAVTTLGCGLWVVGLRRKVISYGQSGFPCLDWGEFHQ